MAFEQITNLKSYKKIKSAGNIESTQIKFEIDNLKTILAAYTSANVSRFEVDGEKATIFAGSKTTIVFVDSENKIASTEKFSEFSFLTAAPSALVSFELVEKETTIEKIDANQFVATAKFDVVTSATIQTDFSAVKPGTEKMIEKTKTIKLQNISATCQDKFVVTDESEITATSILSSEAQCVITSTTAIEDAIVVDGELFVSVVSEIDGNIKQTFRKIDFSGEVVALGLKKDNLVDAKAFVDSFDVTLSSAGANATLNITASIGISALCFGKSEIAVVEDAFSEQNELVVSSQGVDICSLSKSYYACQNGGTVLQTKDKNVNMGTILAVVSPKLEKGILTCTVIYREAETDEISSIIMFANVDVDSEFAGIAIKSFAKKRAKEVMVEYEIFSQTTEQNENYEVFASAIEEGGLLEENNKGIIVYCAKKGDDLFAVAKALKANPEVLKAQNANLDNLVEADRKIIFYRSCI